MVKLDAKGEEIIDEKCANAEDHLKWFIHYILTKRLGPQSLALQAIYIDMIRELNLAQTDKLKSVIGKTLH